ncbi:MAG: glycosyltransferase family 2 protein [Rubritepida sp.]|jgi:hypothetical protein|nr:glycosyltransferase family 2 protein [Rubritepida sp.]MCU0944197.1 glycosyltransferase family 2 protein [Rubritepida sp.]
MMDTPLATTLRIHLYTLSWNEEAQLAFFFRHYDPWVSRYVFYDDGSTDGTLDLLRRHPRVEIRRFERVDPGSFVKSQQKLQNRVWKESRGAADWVVITAVDEHLHRPGFIPWLEAQDAAGVTAIPALGYQMVDPEFPPEGAKLCEARTRGAPYWLMSKLSLFKPDALLHTRFGVGRHRARPEGQVIYPDRDELLLLHYKYVGLEYVQRRQASLARGLGTEDFENGWAQRYEVGDAAVEKELRRFLARAVDVADPARDHHLTHQEPRWWRETPANG